MNHRLVFKNNIRIISDLAKYRDALMCARLLQNILKNKLYVLEIIYGLRIYIVTHISLS